MKPLPIAVPVIAKSACLALVVLISCLPYSTQSSAQPQQNPLQTTPNVSVEGTTQEPEAAKPNPEAGWSKTLDVIEKLTTILALTLGGIGAYYKFFRGRTFHARLQPEVSGKLVLDGEVTCLLVRLQLRNVGVSSTYLTEEGTRIDVYSYGAGSYLPTPHLAVWKHLASFRIFADHKWIESGEAITDAHLIPIPAKRQLAFKIEMTVNCQAISFRSKAIIEWKSDREQNLQGKDEGHEPHG